LRANFAIIGFRWPVLLLAGDSSSNRETKITDVRKFDLERLRQLVLADMALRP
jgi:hypothetical protein